MADNVAVTPGTGATFATDDIGGIQYPRVKATWGPDGTANDTDVASGKPMPIQIRHSDGTIMTDSTGFKISSTQLDGNEYETVAASQTTQALGTTGATGDYFRELLVIPATTSPGAIAIKDGSNSAITVFTGGATSVSNLVPFTISLGIASTAGAWQVTTGTNVSCIGIGNFT